MATGKELKQWVDSIDDDAEVAYMIWNESDATEAAKRDGITLTEDEAKEVIYTAHRKQDCSVGITWDTLDYYINEVASNRETDKCSGCENCTCK